MAEFETGGNLYRTVKMNARDQLHLVRSLGPLFPAMARVAIMEVSAEDTVRRLDMMAAFMEAFAKMTRAEVDGLVTQCYSATRRLVGGNGQGPVTPTLLFQGRDMYEDLELVDLMRICWEVIQENLGGFFATGLGSGMSPLQPSPPPSMTAMSPS